MIPAKWYPCTMAAIVTLLSEVKLLLQVTIYKQTCQQERTVTGQAQCSVPCLQGERLQAVVL